MLQIYSCYHQQGFNSFKNFTSLSFEFYFGFN